MTQRIRGMKSEITVQTTLSNRSKKWQSIRCCRIEFRLGGIFNLPALTPAASDDPDAP